MNSREAPRRGIGHCATQTSFRALGPSSRGYLLPLDLKGLGLGLLSSACCILPPLLLAFGLGGLSSAMGSIRYAPLIGGGLLVSVLYVAVRRSNQGIFSLAGILRARWALTQSLEAFGLAWGLATYMIAPFVGRLSAGFPTGPPPQSAGVPAERVIAPRQLALRIEGMYCRGCIGAVESRLSRLRGVSSVEVWMGGARLIYDASVVSPQKIESAATFYVFRASIEKDSAIP